MTTRTATCQCGLLSVACAGEPVRISVCHCLACQRRSGSAFAAQARFPIGRATVAGASRQWIRTSDKGNPVTCHFCPACGSTVYYLNEPRPDVIAIPVGAFVDPAFPGPTVSVHEERKHRWVDIAGEQVEHQP